MHNPLSAPMQHQGGLPRWGAAAPKHCTATGGGLAGTPQRRSDRCPRSRCRGALPPADIRARPLPGPRRCTGQHGRRRQQRRVPRGASLCRSGVKGLSIQRPPLLGPWPRAHCEAGCSERVAHSVSAHTCAASAALQQGSSSLCTQTVVHMVAEPTAAVRNPVTAVAVCPMRTRPHSSCAADTQHETARRCQVLVVCLSGRLQNVSRRVP